MRTLFFLPALAFCFVTVAVASPALATTVVVVRHAEKQLDKGDDPSLTPAGQEHAKALAKLLDRQKIDAIFTSDMKRTQETAAPLATAKKVTPVVVKAGDT